MISIACKVFARKTPYPRVVVSAIAADVVLALLTDEDRRAIVRFRDELRARYGARVRDLRLYGSKVRGDDHAESDIDLLVLLDAVDWPTERAIINLAGDIDPRLAPAIDAFDHYHAPPSRATGYYKEMRRESVRL